VKGRSSIAARAAWAAFASAGFAAALAAILASVLADLFVLQRTDLYLVTVATEVTRELGSADDVATIESVLRDEQQEVTSTGIRLAIYGSAARPLAGDTNVPSIEGHRCTTVGVLRVCSVPVRGERHVVAATLRETSSRSVAIAAFAAAALAGCVAWGLARVLSRGAVGPLVRLQGRLAGLPLDGATPARALGEDEGVAEVDELRAGLHTLLGRMHDALERSSNFAASAAHELRTPLTALRAELELMVEAKDAISPDSLRVALRKVAQLQSLTERLLVLATPDGGGDEGLEVVSLRDVVDEALSLLPAEEAARISIEEETDACVLGDAPALGMLVSNGLSNALKFGNRVRLEIRSMDGTAVLAIEDDGPGVPEGDRARMFEPFARGGGAKRVPGHGLGLALVAHVAKRHRGRALLTGARHVPKGTRLEVQLPLVAG
jgi:signal transduction histidine kinase